MPPLLTARALSRRVGERHLWGPLDLGVEPGEVLAVAGPSGSGKSLLLRALAGLDPLQGGEVRYQSRALEDWGAPRYRAGVMYLPQQAPLYPGTVEDNLRLPFGLKVHAGTPYPADEARDRLAALGRSSNFLAQPAERLSGGEAQLVALVRALLLSPGVLLLDEATGALDPQAVAGAEALLRDWLAGGPPRAVVFVTHDPAQRERLATRRLDLQAVTQ